MGWYERLRRRWQRRFGGGTWVLSEAVLIKDVTCQEVWDLVRPAESAVGLTDETVRAYTEPGTGGGVGEVQVFFHVHDDGAQHVLKLEVVEERPPFLAVTRSLEAEAPGMTAYELTQLGAEVELRVTFSLEVAAGQVLDPQYEEGWHSFWRGYLGRVREALEPASA